jgi:acyl-CoA dehydrogenase
VLRTAWLIDKHQDYRKVRGDIAAVKAAMPKVFVDAVYRAMHLHGALGVSNEMPFTELWVRAAVMGIVDGPTEVHKVTLAREVLKGYSSATGAWPTEHLPSKRDDARRKLADVLDREAAEF